MGENDYTASYFSKFDAKYLKWFGYRPLLYSTNLVFSEFGLVTRQKWVGPIFHSKSLTSVVPSLVELRDSGLQLLSRVRETFELNQLKSAPFTTSTGFFGIWPVANLLPFTWTAQYPISFSKCRLILFVHCNDNRPRTWAFISKPVF